MTTLSAKRWILGRSKKNRSARACFSAVLLGAVAASTDVHADSDCFETDAFGPGLCCDVLTTPELPESWSLHGQTTVVPQGHLAFHSPYSGSLSLTSDPQVAVSWTATVFAGVGLWSGAAIFVNPEIAAGTGLSFTHGVAAFPNAEIYRVDRPAPRFNWSRLFIQQVWRLGPDDLQQQAGFNQLAGIIPLQRLTLVVGKFSLNDYFDTNAYSHDPRTQFLNWALMDTGAYDYAADTRGYTWGVYVEANLKQGAVRAAAALEPATANGPTFAYNLQHAGSLNVEGEFRYRITSMGAGSLRGLIFDNRAHMGDYAQALTQARGVVPQIASTRGYRHKWGSALTLEQSLGETCGMFARLGWADGRYESWAFTEIERSLAIGGQIIGSLWHQQADRIGLAVIVSGISTQHARYLQAGGLGFILGDGALRYAPETVLEAYYAWQPQAWLTVTADAQAVFSPGFNQDRGAVYIAALRLHLEH